MARSAVREAAQAAGLLRLQRLRELRARADCATAEAALFQATQATGLAQQSLTAMRGQVEAAGRVRWDGATGTVLSAAGLSRLREDEDRERGGVDRLATVLTLAEQVRDDAAEAAAGAATVVAVAAVQTARRERLDAECGVRLRRVLAWREELMLEDEPSPARTGP